MFVSEAGERHASWLELFFDLVVVVAVAQLAHGLHHPTWGAVALFVLLYYAVWSSPTLGNDAAWNAASDEDKRNSVWSIRIAPSGNFETTDTATETTVSVKRVATLFVCVLLLSVGLIWAWLSMRAVMGVGGSCASGGPYEIATPCPDGSWLIAIAIPMMIIAAMAGSAFASSLNAPNLLMPMWFLLFASLGWNFLEFGFWHGDIAVGFIVCGVLFELMAFPVLFLVPLGLRNKTARPAGTPSVWFWVHVVARRHRPTAWVVAITLWAMALSLAVK